MQTFSIQQCKSWLEDRGVASDPYRNDLITGNHNEKRTVVNLHGAAAFIRNILNYGLKPAGEVLVQVTDWSLYSEDEMAIFQSIRASSGETRALVDAPGHLFPAAELNHCIGLFNLTLAYRWSAYIYIPDAPITIHNWEGEILEFWSGQKQIVDLVHEFCRSHRLE